MYTVCGIMCSTDVLYIKEPVKVELSLAHWFLMAKCKCKCKFLIMMTIVLLSE